MQKMSGKKHKFKKNKHVTIMYKASTNDRIC